MNIPFLVMRRYTFGWFFFNLPSIEGSTVFLLTASLDAINRTLTSGSGPYKCKTDLLPRGTWLFQSQSFLPPNAPPPLLFSPMLSSFSLCEEWVSLTSRVKQSTLLISWIDLTPTVPQGGPFRRDQVLALHDDIRGRLTLGILHPLLDVLNR